MNESKIEELRAAPLMELIQKVRPFPSRLSPLQNGGKSSLMDSPRLSYFWGRASPRAGSPKGGSDLSDAWAGLALPGLFSLIIRFFLPGWAAGGYLIKGTQSFLTRALSSPAGRLEHHGPLGRGQLQRDAAEGDGALPHLALLLRLRQRRLQKLQQQRHPGGSVGARPAVAGLLPEQDREREGKGGRGLGLSERCRGWVTLPSPCRCSPGT